MGQNAGSQVWDVRPHRLSSLLSNGNIQHWVRFQVLSRELYVYKNTWKDKNSVHVVRSSQNGNFNEHCTFQMSGSSQNAAKTCSSMVLFLSDQITSQEQAGLEALFVIISISPVATWSKFICDGNLLFVIFSASWTKGIMLYQLQVFSG